MTDKEVKENIIIPSKGIELCDKEWFAAFDPGKVNFAFIIEEIDKNMLKDIVCPIKKDRFVKANKSKEEKEEKKTKKTKNDVSPSDKYSDFLDEFYHCGKTILCSNNDITKIVELNDSKVEEEKPTKRRRKTKEEKEEEKKQEKEQKKSKAKGSKALDAGVFLRLTDLLDRHKEYFDRCSTIIIEQQMSFGSRVNTMAIKIAQHTYSYFLFRYGNKKKIVEFPSYNKTQLLGAPAGLDKPKRKKWAIEKANEIWTLRGDMDTIDMITKSKKKDDMSDCLLHVLAYILHNYY
jgi:hypothetical protein